MLRRLVIAAVDTLLIVGAFAAALLVRFQDTNILPFLTFLGILIPLRVACFALLGIYSWSFRYAGVWEGVQLLKGTVLGSLLFAAVLFAFKTSLNSTLVVLFEGMFSLGLIGLWRFSYRIVPYFGFPRAGKGLRTLIVGAGDAGETIAREFLRTRGEKYLPVGFIDDDPNKSGVHIHKWKVLGNSEEIPEVVQQQSVDVILLALPPLPGDEIRRIISSCEKTQKPIKTLPALDSLFKEDGKPIEIRDFRAEDLLTRAEIQPCPNLLKEFLSDKRILVTGGAGSIGSELVRQILDFSPKHLIALDRNENDLYLLHCELAGEGKDFQPVIADILDTPRMEKLFAQVKPDIVFHAAAFKHVPLMEEYPQEALQNNILGTAGLARLAHRFGVKKFVNISTDKAVNPSSVMGATKRVGELFLQEMAQKSSTQFCTVRFGNVIGSKGSVVQIFQDQIRRGKPITVTHPEMKRYFMTVREGVCLVLEAGAVSNGGEVFMLKMGDEISIVDLAKHLIALHQLVPGKDVEIKFTGMRPGEKLSEELLGDEEAYLSTSREHLLLVKLPPHPQGVEEKVDELSDRLQSGGVDYFEWLSTMVTEAQLRVKTKTDAKEVSLPQPQSVESRKVSLPKF